MHYDDSFSLFTLFVCFFQIGGQEEIIKLLVAALTCPHFSISMNSAISPSVASISQSQNLQDVCSHDPGALSLMKKENFLKIVYENRFKETKPRYCLRYIRF